MTTLQKIALGLLLVGGAGAFGYCGGKAHEATNHDREFEQREAKRDEERDELAKERDAALVRAATAEAKIPLLEQDIADRDTLIAKASGKIQAADVARAEAVEVYENEQATLGQPVDPVERRRRACAALTKLGFPCE